MEEPASHVALLPFSADPPEIAQIPALAETYAQAGRRDTGGNGRLRLRRLTRGF